MKYIKTKLASDKAEDPNYIPKDVAEAVIKRARGRCELCEVQSGVPLQLAHVIAKGMGGRHGDAVAEINSVENIRYLCEICHFRLFHDQVIRYPDGSGGYHGCDSCWLRNQCVDNDFQAARVRGILPALDAPT